MPSARSVERSKNQATEPQATERQPVPVSGTEHLPRPVPNSERSTERTPNTRGHRPLGVGRTDADTGRYRPEFNTDTNTRTPSGRYRSTGTGHRHLPAGQSRTPTGRGHFPTGTRPDTSTQPTARPTTIHTDRSTGGGHRSVVGRPNTAALQPRTDLSPPTDAGRANGPPGSR